MYRDTLRDLGGHLGRHLLTSLPTVVVWTVSSLAVYRLTFGLIPPLHAAWFWMEDELVSTLLYVFVGFLVLPIVSAVVPYVPLYVGMLHAQHRWIGHGEPLGLTSGLSHAGIRLLPAMVVLAPMWMLESGVWWAGILPAVVVEAVLGFAVAAVVVHGLRPGAAMRLSVTHFLHAPLWRLGFAAVLLAAIGVSGLAVLPMLLLPAFCTNATIRAYRGWFGGDPVPRPL